MGADAVKRFFSSPNFAVAGASQDTKKFGYKLLAWYHAHALPVTPINPRTPAIKVGSTACSTVASPSALPSPSDFSLSIVTPPSVTLTLLREAKKAGVPAVWLQPGTYDKQCLDYAKEAFEAAVGGEDGGKGGEGWCVLMDGEDGLKAVGRKGAAARM